MHPRTPEFSSVELAAHAGLANLVLVCPGCFGVTYELGIELCVECDERLVGRIPTAARSPHAARGTSNLTA
jgi:hypothetical protein